MNKPRDDDDDVVMWTLSNPALFYFIFIFFKL